MKILKKVLIIMFIIIVILIVAIVMLTKNNDKEVDVDKEMLDKGNGNVEYIPDTKVKKVSDKIKYYAIKSTINEYFGYINLLPENQIEEDRNMALQALNEMYNDEYKNTFNITNEKLKSEDFTKYVQCTYEIKDMYMTEKSKTVSIFLLNVEIQETSEILSFIVGADWQNSAFEIYGDDYVKSHKYNENVNELNNLNIDHVDLKIFNKIKGKRITDEDMAVQYFNNYKYKMLNNLEESYSLLDEEYRDKRFSNIDEYAQFIDENREILMDIQPIQYIFNDENYNEYVCKDQYENLYIFRENAIMDYTVKLDTYTIMTDKFKQEYLQGNDNKKVMMDIDKFIQMINNYDYKSAYALLNDTFKQNNFETEELFKQYMQSKYYRYNDIGISECLKENDVYVCKTVISNKQNSQEQNNMNIVIKLNNGIDFEMSFEIIE